MAFVLRGREVATPKAVGDVRATFNALGPVAVAWV